MVKVVFGWQGPVSRWMPCCLDEADTRLGPTSHAILAC